MNSLYTYGHTHKFCLHSIKHNQFSYRFLNEANPECKVLYICMCLCVCVYKE